VVRKWEDLKGLKGAELQVGTLEIVLADRERELLERAAAQKDIGDKGSVVALGAAYAFTEAADVLRGIRTAWIEEY